MPNIKVTVLLPVYNGQEYIRESIDSILKQTFKDFELLIINDGSTDNTGEILNRYKDKRIRIITHKCNKKLICSLNEGLKIARGEYIVRMDADDVCLPKRLAEQVSYMDNNPQICASGTALMRSDSERIWYWVPLIDPAEIKAQLLFESPLAHPTVILRKKMVHADRLFYSEDYLHVEDYELWLRIAENHNIGNIIKTLLLYRVHTGQITRVYNVIKEKNAQKVRIKVLRRMGVIIQDGDLKIHDDLVNLKLKAGIRKIVNWSECLINSNIKKKYFNQQALEKVLAEKIVLYLLYFLKKNGLNRDIILIIKNPLIVKIIFLGTIRIILRYVRVMFHQV